MDAVLGNGGSRVTLLDGIKLIKIVNSILVNQRRGFDAFPTVVVGVSLIMVTQAYVSFHALIEQRLGMSPS